MCDTHLIPDVDELRQAVEAFVCPECEDRVQPGESYRHIEGTLDDGSPGRLLYRAHDDCYLLNVLDYDDNDGCFTYHGVEALP